MASASALYVENELRLLYLRRCLKGEETFGQDVYLDIRRKRSVMYDDYGCLPQCRKAVEDFRFRREIADKIEEVDWTGAFWRKTQGL